MPMLHPHLSPAVMALAAREARRDDYILAAMLIALGGWRVVLALATGEAFGTEPTIATIMTALGVLIALAAAARR